MVEATIHLGGQDYVIRRMPAMRAVAWRKQAQSLLERFPALEAAYQEETDNLVKAAASLYGQANGLVEALIEVVLHLDAALQRDRERILDEAYEEEFMEALQQGMTLNLPLSQMAQLSPSTLNGHGEALPTT